MDGLSAGAQIALRDAARTQVRAEAWRFGIVPAHARAPIERFISSAYARVYGARIPTFMPHLAALHRDDELFAACGLRCGEGERLFLETYLDEAVEERLATVTGAPQARRSLYEIGNLAIGRPGAARALIALLTEYLLERDARWVVFTAVPMLRNNFRRLGIPLHVLGHADPARLTPEAREQWGSYYDHMPQVSAVRVADSAAALRRAR